MRDILVLISFDTAQFITAIKVRGNHKIVSNIWNPCWDHTSSHRIKSSTEGLRTHRELFNSLQVATGNFWKMMQ